MSLLCIIRIFIWSSIISTPGHCSLAHNTAEGHLACNTDVQRAARDGDVGRLQALLSDPRVDPGANDDWAIRMAAANGRTDCVKLLLADPRANPAACKNWAIRLAVLKGHVGCVELLIADSRVDPTVYDNGPIFWTARNGHARCVALLLADPRVNPAARNNEAVRMAAENSRIECLKLLLADPRVDPSAIRPNACGSSVRHFIGCIPASKDGDLEAFKKVIPSTLPDDVLDILVSRNRAFPEVLSLLLPAWLARLDIPGAVRNDPIYGSLLHLAIPRGICSPNHVCELTKTFISFKSIHPTLGDLAAIFTLHAHGLVQ